MNIKRNIEDVVLALIENNTAGCISKYEVVPTNDRGLLIYDNEGNSLRVITEENIYYNQSNNSAFAKLVKLLMDKGYREVTI